MKITIEAVGLELSAIDRDGITAKFRGVQKFVKRFEGEGETTVEVEVVRITKHHKKGDVFEVVAGVRLPKKSIRVAEVADEVMTAVDRVKDVLREEIEKYKEKVVVLSKTQNKK